MPVPTRAKKVPDRPKKTGVVDRIKKMHFDDDDGISLLLYGMSGSGKTRTWSTFPGKILAVIISGGQRPGELRSVYCPENVDRIDTVTLEKPAELRDLVEMQQETGAYSTLVIDHVSGFQDLVLKEILGLDEMPVQKHFGFAQQEDYGTCTMQCKEYLRGVLNLPCNKVFVAHERTFNVEGSRGDVIMPTVGASLLPKLTEWLNGSVDYIGQNFKRKVTRKQKVKKEGGTITVSKRVTEFCLRTGADETFHTKFRLPTGVELPDDIVDPTYDKIMKLIRGGD